MPFDPIAALQQAGSQLTGCPPGYIKDPSGKCVKIPPLPPIPDIPPGILAEMDKYIGGGKQQKANDDSTLLWVIASLAVGGVVYYGYREGWFKQGA